MYIYIYIHLDSFYFNTTGDIQREKIHACRISLLICFNQTKTKPTVFHSFCDVIESLVIGIRRPQDGGERAPGPR